MPSRRLRPMVCYAVKANSNQAVLRLFAGLGAGADVVSEGELRRALAAGIPAERIVFSGVGKTREELTAALAADIHQINVESVPELRRLSEIASVERPDRAHRDPGQSGCRCADPRQDRHRQEGKQVRHRHRRRRRGVPSRRRTAGHRAGRPGDAYRLADRRARTVCRSL